MAESPAARHNGLAGPIGIALGERPGELTAELVEAALAGARDLGYPAHVVRRGDDQSGLGAMLGIGYPGSFMSVFDAPPCCPRVLWVGEALVRLDEPVAGTLARIARSRAMDYFRYPLRPFKDAPLPGRLARLRASATIDRERGRNLRQLAGLAVTADRVVVTSRDRRATLLEYGLEADAVPFGYSPAVAGPIVPPGRGDRDLAFVSLGRLHPRMAGRRSIVEVWRDDEPRLTVLDGVWGAERSRLLARSKVVVNVARSPGEFVGIRLVLALAAGAVPVSEPMADPYPFVAGVHFVAAPLDGLLDAARELAADEPRRRRIAEAGQTLIAGELSMARCLARALGLEA